MNYDYKSDVLAITGNKKYAKRERKSGINIIAVKITNNTTQMISVKNGIKFMTSGREIVPVESYIVEDNIKQKNIGFYALYCLLTLNITENGETAIYPFGIGIAAGNIALAVSSNSQFRKNFSEENIMNKRIPPGETIYGLAAFKNLQSYKLEMELRN